MYDIPNDINLEDFGGSADAPAPTPQGGLPGEAGQASTSSSYDPNMIVNYKASGRDLAEPLSSVISRAQRGYDYAQLVQQHKMEVAQQQAQFEERQRQIAEMESQWKPYHDFASQNPQWAEYVRQQWENRFNSPQQEQSIPSAVSPQQAANLPPEIVRELSEVRQFIASVKQKEQLAIQAEQDAALNTEIEGIRKQYPDVDFSHTDPETGESLEARVLRHAQEKRIYNFSAAFKDFYFDKLMERNVMNAKESVAKQMQIQTKNGFLASSNTPMLVRESQPSNLKNVSYSQLMDMASKELGF